MDRFSFIEKRIESQENRILRLEKELNIKTPQVEILAPVEEEVKEAKVSHISSITFTQVLSFLGVGGIVIGLLSLFFYAIANEWISETAQILIGVSIGLILYVLGIFLNKSNEEFLKIYDRWSTLHRIFIYFNRNFSI